MQEHLAPTSPNGNGQSAYPLSRRAFARGLPRRIAAIEDQFANQAQRLDAGDALLARVETRLDAIEAALTARVDNLAEHTVRIDARTRRIDQRSLRSRRRVAVIAHQIEADL